MNIGLIKQGIETYIYTDKENTNESRRTGSPEFKALGDLLSQYILDKDSNVVYYLKDKPDTRRVYNVSSQNIIIKDYNELYEDIAKLDYLAIYPGPSDTEWSREQMKFLRKHSKDLKVLVFAGDTRFNKLPILDKKFKYIRYFANVIKECNGLHPFRIDLFSVLFELTNYSKETGQDMDEVVRSRLKNRQNKIMLLMNEVIKGKTRANRIIELLGGLNYPFETYGKWSDPIELNLVKWQGELNSVKEKIEKTLEFKFGLVIHSHYEAYPDKVDYVGGISNHLICKVWEYALLGCLPILDIRHFEYNDFLPRILQIRDREDLGRILNIPEEKRQELLKELIDKAELSLKQSIKDLKEVIYVS